MRRMLMSKIVFITGTDTGVGKTVVTALLLRYLRERGVNALAMKPFCSGGREDAELLHQLQTGNPQAETARRKYEVTLDEVNPFYFAQPLAPWVAVKQGRGGKQVPLKTVLRKISELQKRCDVLLIEGSGGLLVPLGERYTVLDLIRALPCRVMVVGQNKLGVINHSLLALCALQVSDVEVSALVLTNCKKGDFSSSTNLDVIEKWSNCGGQLGVFEVPYLGKQVSSLREIARGEKKVKKVLAGIWECL
jgi:dethiobiotin synthetase